MIAAHTNSNKAPGLIPARTLIFSLGRANGYNGDATQAIGRPYAFIQRHAIVV